MCCQEYNAPFAIFGRGINKRGNDATDRGRIATNSEEYGQLTLFPAFPCADDGAPSSFSSFLKKYFLCSKSRSFRYFFSSIFMGLPAVRRKGGRRGGEDDAAIIFSSSSTFLPSSVLLKPLSWLLHDFELKFSIEKTDEIYLKQKTYP